MYCIEEEATAYWNNIAMFSKTDSHHSIRSLEFRTMLVLTLASGV